MTRDTMGKRTGTRRDYWRDRIAQQERSGVSVSRFCKERGLTEQSFYLWRRRLREQEPVRFALIETGAAQSQPATEPALELILATGERLRIGAGVDATALRTVLEALRA